MSKIPTFHHYPVYTIPKIFTKLSSFPFYFNIQFFVITKAIQVLQFNLYLCLQTLTLLNFTPLNNIYVATSQHSAISPYHPIPLFLPYSHILYSIILTIFRYFDLININIYILPIHILSYPIPVFLCIP